MPISRTGAHDLTGSSLRGESLDSMPAASRHPLTMADLGPQGPTEQAVLRPLSLSCHPSPFRPGLATRHPSLVKAPVRLVPALAWGPSRLLRCVTHIWGCPGGEPSILWPKDAAAPFCPATCKRDLWIYSPGRALGLCPPSHALPRVSSRVQPWFLAVSGLDSDGPWDSFPTPGQFVQAPSHGGPRPP